MPIIHIFYCCLHSFIHSFIHEESWMCPWHGTAVQVTSRLVETESLLFFLMLCYLSVHLGGSSVSTSHLLSVLASEAWKGYYNVALGNVEFDVWTKLSLNRSACLCLLSDGIKGMHRDTRPCN